MAKTRKNRIPVKHLAVMGVGALLVVAMIFAISHFVLGNTTVFGGSRELVVFLDPGHGGNDRGASVGSKRVEKDDNLKMALAVKDILEQRGIKAEMSRTTDVNVALSDRCDMANKSKATLFVSVHRNSAESGKGVEIWAKSNKPKADTTLAGCIMDNLDKAGISNNRGVRFGYMGNPKTNYFVNNATDMPSCLVELGFITSDEDNQLLDKNFEGYANAIADGIVDAGKKLKMKVPVQS